MARKTKKKRQIVSHSLPQDIVFIPNKVNMKPVLPNVEEKQAFLPNMIKEPDILPPVMVKPNEVDLKAVLPNVEETQPSLLNIATKPDIPQHIVVDPVEKPREERRVVHYIICETGNIHIIEPCPRCCTSHRGMLTGTAFKTNKGLVPARCLDCGETASYYIDPKDGPVWHLEAVELKKDNGVGWI